MQLHCSLHGRLSVKFGWHQLEKHIFHHVRRVWALELEFSAFEQDIVETPCLGCQHGVVAAFATLHKQGEVHGTRTGITGRP